MSTLTKKKRLNKQTVTLKNKFATALDTLDQAKPFAKSLYQTDIFQLAIELARSTDGLSVLYGYAHRFDQAGVFLGGLWEDPTKMEPQLVGGSLKIRGINSILNY